MDLSGTWTGEYEYESPSASWRVTFTLHLKQGWLGRIKGTVRDGPGGMPETGRIVGWLRGTRLTFRKEMPVFRLGSGTTTVPVAEYLVGSGDLRISPSTPHPPIRYSGTVQSDGNSVSGQWSVTEHVVRLEDQEKALQFAGYNGSWSARRGE